MMAISNTQYPAEEVCTRVVVAVDPAVSCGKNSDETGIIVAGLMSDGRGIVLDDLSGHYRPEEWIRQAIKAYEQFQADVVVAEVNQGGDLVEALIRQYAPHISFKAVRATRGKMVRAEPVAALYERGLIYHARPFQALETQMCSYVPGRKNQSSPDRLDALVWAFTELFLQEEAFLLPRCWYG